MKKDGPNIMVVIININIVEVKKLANPNGIFSLIFSFILNKSNLKNNKSTKPIKKTKIAIPDVNDTTKSINLNLFNGGIVKMNKRGINQQAYV